MAVNPYFNQNLRGTQNLYEDLVLESIKIYGQDVYYLPRETVNEDTIFGDLEASRFENAYKVEMYIENIEGFDGEGDLFTKFGVEIRDEATFIVARRRWTSAVARAQGDADIIRPREGDLIYLPLSKSMFQIQHVEHEQPFYQLNNLPIFKMRSQLFEYSGEDFDTGVDDIQDIEEKYAYEFLLQLDSGAAFTVGDNIKQSLTSGVTLTGEISRYSDSDKIMGVINFGGDDGIFHLPTTDVAVFHPTNTFIRSRVLSVTENNQLSENEQNDAFETTTTDLGFLDFSESNPFGDPQ